MIPGRLYPLILRAGIVTSTLRTNPLKFTDPTGEDLSIIGAYAAEIVADLENFSGFKLKRDGTTGNRTIDWTQKRNVKGTSIALEAESETIGDFNGWWQKPRTNTTTGGAFNIPPMTMKFIYSTVEYDVVFKAGAKGRASQAEKVTKIDKTPKKPKK